MNRFDVNVDFVKNVKTKIDGLDPGGIEESFGVN
jgi:hypothetical protein